MDVDMDYSVSVFLFRRACHQLPPIILFWSGKRQLTYRPFPSLPRTLTTALRLFLDPGRISLQTNSIMAFQDTADMS